jgi:CRISPR-associated protein Csb2
LRSLPCDAGHSYADGHVMGFALWLPQGASLEVIDSLETVLARLDTLTMGRQGRWDIQYISPVMAARGAKSLDSNAYIQDSTIWASVTPAVFGRYPKKSQIGPGKDGGPVFAELCEWIGLPRPAEVRLGSVSAFNGVPRAAEFMMPERFATRFRAHVWLRFDEPVHGPVLIGAGQFNGFGFCKPWRQP